MRRKREVEKPRNCRSCIFAYYRDGKLMCVFGKAVMIRRPCKDFIEIEGS